MICDILTDKLSVYDDAYVYFNDNYYYLANENIEKINSTETCNKIKKLLLQK